MAYSQQHMTFQGIPIAGTLDSMIISLKSKGFNLDKCLEEYDAAIMNGNFAGKQAELYILRTHKSKQVWKIAVYFEENESWYSLKREYYEYKEAYKTKYGKPTDSFEYFVDPYYEGDGYELQALRLDKCTYLSVWELETGSIGVQLNDSGRLTLGYEDKINRELKNKEEKRSIIDDI